MPPKNCLKFCKILRDLKEIEIMKLLIIGRARFIGRGIVGAALQFNQRVYMPDEDPATWRRYFDGYSVGLWESLW